MKSISGKNAVYFSQGAECVLSLDLSPEMLKTAKSKIKKDNVTFLQHDILSTRPAESNKFAAPAPKGIKEGRKKGLELVTLKIERIQNEG
ncbi:MAG: class I SAM-dependent methyltransferase [Calditrichaceae bacterium]